MSSSNDSDPALALLGTLGTTAQKERDRERESERERDRRRARYRKRGRERGGEGEGEGGVQRRVWPGFKAGFRVQGLGV